MKLYWLAVPLMIALVGCGTKPSHPLTVKQEFLSFVPSGQKHDMEWLVENAVGFTGTYDQSSYPGNLRIKGKTSTSWSGKPLNGYDVVWSLDKLDFTFTFYHPFKVKLQNGQDYLTITPGWDIDAITGPAEVAVAGQQMP